MGTEVDPDLLAEIARGLVAPSTDRPTTLDDVPGWFSRTDQDLFGWILTDLAEHLPGGDIVELGAFLGKSAIHLGSLLRESERLVVCDLFGSDVPRNAMSANARAFYSQPVRSVFERNYRCFHHELPAVVQAPTSEILNHVAPGSCRFAHVDASHEYDNVHADMHAVRQLLVAGGVVAFDDYRAEHTPGTAAAVWEAVRCWGLQPICLTEDKFYGTWGDAAKLQEALIGVLARAAAYTFATHLVMGYRVIRVVRRSGPAASAPPIAEHPA
ncbi:class I SAM-dependent methyltransferase [Nocardia sp. NPDC057030]|uniref:class I SAM-dependent methyltransferase n=1 Tax=unclassified Nocardia TaxID=2637762 RepID=UPI00363BF072